MRRSSRSCVDRVELRGGLRELVVGLGQHARLHVLHEDGHVGGLAGELLAGALGDLLGDLQDVPGLLAEHLGVERGAELARAHEVEVVGALEPVDLLAAGRRPSRRSSTKSPSLHGPLGGLQLGEPLAEPVHPVVDLLVGDLDGGPHDLHALVVGLGELEARTHLDHRGEHQRPVVVERLVQVDLGVG